MASRKYLEDYRLENVEINGRLKTVAVYRGKYYRFRNLMALRRERPKLLVCAAAFWLSELTALLVPAGIAHYAFIILPMVFAMLPFWFASLGIYSAMTAPPEMTREQAEKTESRLAGGSLIAAALSGAAVTGSFVVFLLTGRTPSVWDILFILCAAAQTAAAVICFRLRGCVKTDAVSESAGHDGR